MGEMTLHAEPALFEQELLPNDELGINRRLFSYTWCLYLRYLIYLQDSAISALPCHLNQTPCPR